MTNIAGNVAGGVADRLVVQPDPTVELLESELRWMEDNIYRLDHQLETTLRQLDSTKRNNAALRLELAKSQHVQSHGGIAVPSTAIGQGEPTPTRADAKYDEEESDDDSSGGIYDLAPPVVDLGDDREAADDAEMDDTYDLPKPRLESNEANVDPAKPESILAPGEEPSQGVRPKIELPDNPFEDDAVQPRLTPGETNEITAPPAVLQEVTRILLNRRLTGGYSFDGQAGHDGIMVVIEPQDAYARYVAMSGPVTVELRDPSKPGVLGQVGKWSFSDSEIQPLLKQTLMGKGIHLELPWPAGSPTAEKLELMVEYQSRQGKKLTARQPLRIQPTTAALVNEADAAEQGFFQSQSTAARWKPTR